MATQTNGSTTHSSQTMLEEDRGRPSSRQSSHSIPDSLADSGVSSGISGLARSWRARVTVNSQVKHRRTGFCLRTWTKMAVICIRLCKQSVDNLARTRGQYQSVMQVMDEYGAKISFRGQTFSRKDYRANDQHSLSRGARKLLQQEPYTRTERDINMLLVALRHIPAFAEYPRKMQWQLCQVGRFEAYEPRRVVLKEGDVPTSFYFILSGTVIVTAFEEATQTSRTLVSLTKGMSFGELAVISNTRRQGTVCTRTDVQLLSISGQEFKEIFMAGGRDILGSEKQREFIRGVSFLRHWPVERLRDDPRSCTIYYFDRNQVLVRDSNNSDWIYIVLKGSLSVVKKLKRVDPELGLLTSRKRKGDTLKLSKKNKVLHRENGILDKNTSFSLDFDLGHDKRSSPIFQANHKVFKTPYELEFKLEQTLPGYRNSKDRLGTLNYDNIIDSFHTRLLSKDTPHAGRHLDHHVPDSQAGLALQHAGDYATKEPDALDLMTSNSLSSMSSCVSSSRPASESSFMLPDITFNNKTVITQHTSHKNGRIRTKERNNEIEKVIGCERKGADHQECVDNHFEFGGDVRVTNVLQKKGSHGKQSRRRRQSLVNKTAKGVYLASSKMSNHEEARPAGYVAGDTTVATPLQTPCHHDISPQQQTVLDTGSPRNGDETVEAKLARLQIQYQRRVIDREGRKTIAEELDHKARRDFKFSEADLDPTIIELQVLERGQYFGLAPIIFQDQSSLSVVSNGAECLVISKKLFLQCASEKCLRHLRQTESPYPSEQELTRKLQEMVNWQANRSKVYHRLAHQIAERKARRKQFLPTFQGQYCFRTGPA